MHRSDALSTSLQMYLKTILQLQTQNHVARVKEIAEALDVTGATVSSAVKSLEEKGLVNHARYGYITLTDEGKHLADCVQKRFEVLKAFLTDVLQVDPQTAEEDACKMEHDISVATLERLATFVQFLQDDAVPKKAAERFDAYLSLHPDQFSTPAVLCDECTNAGACKVSG